MAISGSPAPLTTGQKRRSQRIKFEEKIISLFQWAKVNGIYLMTAEAWRTQNTALAYAKAGLGIADSKHCHGIARDLWIIDDSGNPIINFQKGDGSFADVSYKKMADQWISMGERAGYYFSNLFDPYHVELKEDYVH